MTYQIKSNSMFRSYLKNISLLSMQSVSRFVLGNSSVDYDSFFGSIIMAFMLSTTTSNLHLPIIDCKPEEIQSRFEITYVLDLLKIDSSALQYQSALSAIQQESHFNLYDHNIRKGMENIDFIIDHHDPSNPKGNKMLIKKMGSCLTHLYWLLYPSRLQQIELSTQEEREYITSFNEFIKESPFEKNPFEGKRENEIEEIIRYGILIDTFNFDQNQKGRWTVFDKKAVQFIEKDRKFQIGYDQFYQLKYDEKHNKNLTLEAALTKDYKRSEYGGLIIDYFNIYLHPKDFLELYKEKLTERFETQQDTGDVYMLMSICKGEGASGSVERALLLKTKNHRHLQLLTSFLQTLKMEEKGQLGSWHWWKDPTNTISRKLFDKELRTFCIGREAQL